ncbi:MAG: DUF3445 domain-containing protein [Cyclobacteriaceae bacterium]|nr:DUF3445 domain-containing protein [Cyclobacteriaceae bacterium]
MLRYFPFSSTFDLKMGTSALPVNHSIVEIDENYLKEIKLKRKLLSTDHSYYYQSSTVTEKAQWEVVDKILFNLSNSYPDKFTYTKSSAKSQFENKLLKEKVDFAYGDTSTLDMEPMDWVGRQIQEDLLLLDTASILRSGQLCFPSGWDIQSKFEKHFLELHAPLPKLMEPMLQAADKLIERIPFGKPIARTNWGFRITDQLDLSTRRKESYSRLMQILVPKLTIENTGDKIFVRSERQTLSRLSESGFVLFTIHTYNSKVMEETQDIHRAKAMLTFLQGAPPELIEYKVMTPFLDILMSYLKHASE